MKLLRTLGVALFIQISGLRGGPVASLFRSEWLKWPVWKELFIVNLRVRALRLRDNY